MYDSTFTPTLISFAHIAFGSHRLHSEILRPLRTGGRRGKCAFFWDNAINADPEGMTLLFYSSDKGVVYGDLISREEMEVR